MFFLAKKDGTLRMCVDYRGLNNVTVHNKYPLPRIDEMLDRLQGAKVFSSLDLASGYPQLGLQESDVPKTAFCTPDGLVEFLVMPFGLTNASAVFLNAMDNIFRQCRACVCVYMDDLLIFSKSHEQHLQHLRIVLDLLRRDRLFVKPSDCTWLRPSWGTWWGRIGSWWTLQRFRWCGIGLDQRTFCGCVSFWVSH